MNEPGDITCLCNNCSQPLAFAADGAGQTIECPHCRMETLLYRPPGQSAAAAPKPEPPIKPVQLETLRPPEPDRVEDHLESIGKFFYMGGFVGAIICGIGIILSIADDRGGQAISFFLGLLAAVFQGIVLQTIFRGLAEIIRLLRRAAGSKKP